MLGQGGTFAGDTVQTIRGSAGLQGRARLSDSVSLLGHLGAGTTPGFLVLYDDGDPEDETGVHQRLLGGEIGAGVQVAAGGVHVAASIREFWAPWPIQTEGRFDLGIHVADNVSVDIRARHAVRSMAFEVDGEDVETNDSMSFIGLGVSFMARQP